MLTPMQEAALAVKLENERQARVEANQKAAADAAKKSA